MILAVLEKKVGMTMINQDVYVNVVGGMKPDSTSVDLGWLWRSIPLSETSPVRREPL